MVRDYLKQGQNVVLCECSRTASIGEHWRTLEIRRRHLKLDADRRRLSLEEQRTSQAELEAAHISSQPLDATHPEGHDRPTLPAADIHMSHRELEIQEELANGLTDVAAYDGPVDPSESNDSQNNNERLGEAFRETFIELLRALDPKVIGEALKSDPVLWTHVTSRLRNDSSNVASSPSPSIAQSQTNISAAEKLHTEIMGVEHCNRIFKKYKHISRKDAWRKDVEYRAIRINFKNAMRAEAGAWKCKARWRAHTLEQRVKLIEAVQREALKNKDYNSTLSSSTAEAIVRVVMDNDADARVRKEKDSAPPTPGPALSQPHLVD